MKWKVLIVDDDMNFRYAMREVIPWAENDFEIVAEAMHGRQALEILRTEEIHIVLTDMEMPVMNGVVLTDMIKRQYQDVIVIALSAYDDFDFVKESMRLGAEDYILKQDFDGDKIIESLKNLCQKRLNMRGRDVKVMQENDAFIAYIQGKLPQMPLDNQYYKLMGNINLTLCLVNSDSDYEVQTVDRIDENLLFFSKIEEFSWLFIFHMPKTTDGSQQSHLQHLMMVEIQRGFPSKVQFGLCDESGSYADLPQLYLRAVTALQYAAYFPQEYTFHYLDLYRYEKKRKKDYLYQPAKGALSAHLDEFENVLSDLNGQLMENMPENEYINGSFINVYTECLESVFLHINDMEVITYYEGLKQKKSISEKMEYTRECIQNLKEQMIDSFNSSNPAIRMALIYIYHHYAEDISLREISAHVGLSENYFSNLFKQEMHENLVLFINKVRIENARRLLKDPALKVSEIAEAVGFRNATYLSTMFKKITGMSISEYRNQEKALRIM